MSFSLAGIGDMISGLFGGGNNGVMASYNPDMSQMGITESIWNGASPIEQAGILDSMKGLNLSQSLAGSSGLLGGMGMKDWMQLGLGGLALNEQKKNNKLERQLANQQIDRNNVMKQGREDVAGIFQATPSLAAGYIG